ncbi:lipid-A-disaccharide synthase [Porticoccaceae bacterium]|nr:lipid-A-disaccharide synthase [Porticoccaceae bacterium]MDA8651569.1 lipid-A-disaccharide synthase [Porticoccaceae bacterium]MDA8681828.1 lipid-A-disaccharide synthase [Porticoccaceae bacterium]MDB2344165.1 lipid-A-disaccharide synthase [Porticoccaceae bacterium]MDB2634463.1 lipid-A-disaccharide synthase [Porticoccaceae bacterium]
MSRTYPVFALVAGEASGDILGADLIRNLRRLFPDAIFEGVGGDKMKAEGLVSLFDMDRLSVMGLIEPLKRLPELLRMRRAIVRRYKQQRPRVYIGIDSPDFNTQIEYQLRRHGVKTVHYVSPSVWAWRQGRIHKIKKAVDLMLTLFPFEAKYYKSHNIPVCFVGHPLARQLSSSAGTYKSRQLLGLDERPTLCVMPGSRAAEVALLSQVFLSSAKKLAVKIRDLQIVIPAVNEQRYQQIKEVLSEYPELEVKLIKQQSQLAMAAADAVLLASGTTALEAMLLKKPMVVAYRVGAITYTLVAPFVKTPFISIPNLLANKMLVPEFIQQGVSVDNISSAIEKAFDVSVRDQLQAEFTQLQEQLELDSGSLAAAAIADMVCS